MQLKSSSVKAPHVDHAALPNGLGWSIDDRARGVGQRKGRVIAIWQSDTLVAACCWHLHDSGPPVIFDLGCRTDLASPVAKRCDAVLMACLRDIAGERRISRATDRLRWADHPFDRYPAKDRARVRGLVRARAQALGFETLRPRPKWWKGRWAVERRFS